MDKSVRGGLGGLEHGGLEYEELEHSWLEYCGPEHGWLEHGGLEHGGLEHGGLEHGGLEYGGLEHDLQEHSGLEHVITIQQYSAELYYFSWQLMNCWLIYFLCLVASNFVLFFSL